MYNYLCTECGRPDDHTRSGIQWSCRQCNQGVMREIVRGVTNSNPTDDHGEVSQMFFDDRIIKPSHFELLARYDGNLCCYKLEYIEKANTPNLLDFPDGDMDHNLKVHYTDGTELIFTKVRIQEKSYLPHNLGTWEINLIMICELSADYHPPVDASEAWEKIKNFRKPNLFVIEDWKMDLSKTEIDMKRQGGTYSGDSRPLILVKVEKSENDQFGRIDGHPILYLEYPEGKFTFETDKIYINKTVHKDDKKWVPYEFEARLTEKELS